MIVTKFLTLTLNLDWFFMKYEGQIDPKKKLPSKNPALLGLKLARWVLETAVYRCSTKKVFLKTLQNSLKNTCVFLMRRLEAGNFTRLRQRCFCVNFATLSEHLFCRAPPDLCYWVELYFSFFCYFKNVQTYLYIKHFLFHYRK